MRVAILLVAAAGCGRFGFGETSTSGDGSSDDAMFDAAREMLLPQFCDDRVVTTLPIGPLDPVAIRAVALTTGYAVAIETSSAEIPLLEVDATGGLVATHAPFTPSYAPLYGISKHDERPAVHLNTGGTSYIKFVEPGWAVYATGPSGDASMIDPAYAELGPTTGIAARINGGDFEVGLLDDANPAVITNSDYVPTNAIGGSLVPIPGAARVVVERAGGVCETFVVTSQNVTTNLHTFSPCYAPKVAAHDGNTAVIVHRLDDVGPFAVYVIPAVPTDVGVTYPLAGATMARVAARVDGAYWVGHASGSYRAMMRITLGGDMTEHREDTRSFQFDLTERDAFWYDGPTVHVSTPCLR